MILQATSGRVMRVWWSFIWRSVLATIGSMLIAGLIGGIFGFILGMAGMPPEAIRLFGFCIGLFIGLVFSIIPIWLIINKDYGEFQLVLLSKNVTQSEQQYSDAAGHYTTDFKIKP